ncbi:MAG TPA: hypothetical protein VFN74_25180 [Chloroflexota bacterium]|nr:hypothetical protein [Chloroflexota bacterium]
MGRRPLIALVVAGLALAGCGGDDDTETEARNETAKPVQTAEASIQGGSGADEGLPPLKTPKPQKTRTPEPSPDSTATAAPTTAPTTAPTAVPTTPPATATPTPKKGGGED